MLPGMELMNCPNLAVPREVMHHVVRVESSYNPYAIGVVGGHLVRQPRNLPEALATVRMLVDRGYNFSLGLAQVNRHNLVKYGLDSYRKAFEPCANLVAGSRILRECYGRSGGDWGKSFSCYYSGDFVTGYRHGYVGKIYASMRRGLEGQAAGTAPIAIVDRTSRRMIGARSADHRALLTAGSLVSRRGAVALREGHAPPSSAAQLAEATPHAGSGTPATSSLVPAAPSHGYALPTASVHAPFRPSANPPPAAAGVGAAMPGNGSAVPPSSGSTDTAFVF